MSFKTLSICSGCLVLVLAGILSFGSNATPSTFVSTGDFVAPDGTKLFSVDDLTTLDNKIETVSTELDTLEQSVGNNKTEILNALSTNPNLDVNPNASFADITTYIQNMSNVPADTYFYEDGTEGDAATIVRYKKVGAEYFPCDAYGIVSEGAAAVDVSSKTLVPYSATAAGNLSAGSAGYASNSFILGDGSDNAAYMEAGYREGYTQGIADGLSKVNVQYNYHVHEGNELMEGGCYITPVYHAHNSSCSYTTSYPGTRKWQNFMSGSTAYKWTCTNCGEVGYAPEKGQEIPCSFCAVRNYTCGKENTIERYSLGCGKTEDTIESATIIY